MDDPLKQFSFDPRRHGFITALKFIACESISRLKRGDLLYRLLVVSTNMSGLSYHSTLSSGVTLATNRLLTISWHQPGIKTTCPA